MNARRARVFSKDVFLVAGSRDLPNRLAAALFEDDRVMARRRAELEAA